jgi:signal transduction histidine kinase
MIPAPLPSGFHHRYPDLHEFAPVGYVGLDPCGLVCALNATGARLLGGPRARFLGSLLLYRVAKQDRLKFLGHLGDCRRNGTGLMELTLLTSAGRGRPVVLDSRIAAPDDPTDPEGRIRYWISVIDISERKQAEADLRKAHLELAERAAELEAANRALRDSDRRKDEFLAMLGHELRNPLAPIRTTVQVLRRLDSQEPQVQWASDLIERQVAHLTRLVDDLLDVSRITRGKVKLRPQRVDLPRLLAQAVETVQPLLDAQEHYFEATLPTEPVLLDADPDRLIQIVENLLINAVKYTPKGGKIELIVEPAPSAVLISVIDNGIGIAPDMLPQIFDLFAQAEPGLDRSQGGLGIGLTLVRRLVELHGGSVEAASPGPGRGSTFTVRLPMRFPSVASPPFPEESEGRLKRGP